MGDSSFSYLRDLPVHTLKIDRSFVSNIERSAEARRLIEGMIQMAHSLHLKTVAEGVENAEQLKILAEACCDEIQGYHIAAPLPVEVAEQMLRERAWLKCEAAAIKVRDYINDEMLLQSARAGSRVVEAMA